MWWAIMDRKRICEDLQFDSTVKWILHCKSQFNPSYWWYIAYSDIQIHLYGKELKRTCEDEPKVLEPRHITSRPLSAFRFALSW
jgi:hypothetical protein